MVFATASYVLRNIWKRPEGEDSNYVEKKLQTDSRSTAEIDLKDVSVLIGPLGERTSMA
jgi:hypothetical protein